MDTMEASLMLHVGIVFVLLWILSYYGVCYPFFYVIAFIYLFQVNERYTVKLRRRLQFQERKKASQRRVLCDSETVRWLNQAMEKVWPICMEQIASQQILLPIIPWFLDKYKPWTVRKATIQDLYLGRNPPTFTEIRILHQSADDHLVMELGMCFLASYDMSAVMSVKLKKRLGFGMWTKMHINGIHLEGKVLVGVKFLHDWPFLGRLRLCFVEPPYFQMTVKPIFNHGVDVTELPGVAGWLDKILLVAFQQTLVEPNMLVVDLEKFSSAADDWFYMDEKCSVAFAKVEVVEAVEMKPSKFNGLADPYVKGQLGPYRFRTRIQKKTLSPKWQEEFKIPITTWEAPNILQLEVRDKDYIVDDTLGKCTVNVGDLRGGRRHDLWLPLKSISMGRLHLAVTVLDGKEVQDFNDEEISNKEEDSELMTGRSDQLEFKEKASEISDEFEPIGVYGREFNGVFVHHPGSDVCTSWEPKKRKDRHREMRTYEVNSTSMNIPQSASDGSCMYDSSSDDEGMERKMLPKMETIKNNVKKIGSLFNKSPQSESPNSKGKSIPAPKVNVHLMGENGVSLKFVVKDGSPLTFSDQQADNESLSPQKNVSENQGRGHIRVMAKNIIKQAGKSAHSIKHAVGQNRSNKSKIGLGPVTKLEDKQNCDSDESFSSSKEFSPRVEGSTAFEPVSPARH